VDEYWQFRGNYPNQPIEQKLGNPVHHIHNGKVPEPYSLPLTYGLLLNLVSLPGVHDKETAWRFVQRYAPDTSADTHAELDELIGLAVNYARDFVVPTLQRRAPNEVETAALRDLDSELARLPGDAGAEAIQNIVFEVGKRHPFESLRGWFQALFIALYGIDNSRRLIAEALS
jgi:lysyl-tRNA synthetase class 1